MIRLGSCAPTGGNIETVLYQAPNSVETGPVSITVCNRAPTGCNFRIAVVDQIENTIQNPDYTLYNQLCPASDTISVSIGIGVGKGQTIKVMCDFPTLSFNAFGNVGNST